MDDTHKTKKRLTDELAQLHQQLAEATHKIEELEAAEIEHKQVEEELREAHQLLETIYDHTHMMVAYLDPQFNFLRANRAYAQADEREPSFFPGRNHFDLYPNAENEAIFRRVVETGEPHFEYARPFEYAEHPERGVSHWDWSLVPIKGSEGTVVGLILTLLNVTERVQAEEALRQYAKRLRRLAQQVISTQEDERKRIALELHDELGQALTAIGFDLAAIEQALLPGLGPAVERRLARVRSLVSEVDERVSAMALGLRPPMLDDLGLVPALRWYADRYADRVDVEVEVEASDLDERLPQEVETALYRMVQEALTNVTKHARANKVSIRLERRMSSVAVSVEDDGRGFDARGVVGARSPSRGMGLLGMQERVASLGGSLNIESRPGKGTRLAIEIPLEEAEPS